MCGTLSLHTKREAKWNNHQNMDSHNYQHKNHKRQFSTPSSFHICASAFQNCQFHDQKGGTRRQQK